MKKKILVFLVLAVVLLPVYSYENRYGRADAYYEGTTKDTSAYAQWLKFKQDGDVYGYGRALFEVKKLSRTETDLLWAALNDQFYYKAGEVYWVLIGPSERPKDLINLFVEINKDGSATWYGWLQKL